MPEGKSGTDSIRDLWLKTARGRLRLGLGGLAFAMERGFSPEDYARHLWGKGARTWMGKDEPSAAEYLDKEAEAFRCFYPDVDFKVTRAGEESAEIVFTEGCLGGWGDAPRALASSFGLTREDVCRYCREAFRLWAGQLRLLATIGPEGSDTRCVLRVQRAASHRRP